MMRHNAGDSRRIMAQLALFGPAKGSPRREEDISVTIIDRTMRKGRSFEWAQAYDHGCCHEAGVDMLCPNASYRCGPVGT